MALGYKAKNKAMFAQPMVQNFYRKVSIGTAPSKEPEVVVACTLVVLVSRVLP